MAGKSGLLPAGGIRYFRKFLFDTTLSEVDFQIGMVRDLPRTAIPTGGSYTLTDFFTNRPGMLYKRGGTSYKSSAITGQVDIVACATPEFPGDPRILAITSNGAMTRTLYDCTGASPTGAIDLHGAQPTENPKLYLDKLVITSGTIFYPPQKAYLNAGTLTVAKLGGVPPTAIVSCLHAGRLILANTSLYPNRIFFGPATSAESDTIFPIIGVSSGSKTFTIAGDVTKTYVLNYRFSVWGSTGNDKRYTVVTAVFGGTNTVITVLESVPSAVADGNLGAGWDVDNSWYDIDEAVMGLASVQGHLLAFSRGRCHLILGDTPTGYGIAASAANVTIQPLGSVGCIDARSIVVINDMVYVANEAGIFRTNGSTFESLTTKVNSAGAADGGISNLWQTAMAGFSPALGAVVACGAYLEQFLLVSIIHNNGTRSQFCHYIPSGAWVQTSIKTGATMYATSFAPTSEIYAGPSDSAQWSPPTLMALSGMWSPGGSNKNDADGTAVTPVWESRIMSDAIGMKRYGFGHLTYDMRDAASDNPTLETQIATGIEADSGYNDVAESPLAAVTQATRKRFTIYKDSQGLSFKFLQANASAKTEIYSLEGEVGTYYVADGQ